MFAERAKLTVIRVFQAVLVRISEPSPIQVQEIQQQQQQQEVYLTTAIHLHF